MRRKNEKNLRFDCGTLTAKFSLIRYKTIFPIVKMKKHLFKLFNCQNNYVSIFAIFFVCAFANVAFASNFDFNERPQNQTILLGERAILKCAVPPSNTKFDSQSQWRTNTGALLSFHDSGPLPGYGGRYSYVKDGPGELHLQIENISLSDDGKFECQMLRPPHKFLRSSAFVNVLGLFLKY